MQANAVTAVIEGLWFESKRAGRRSPGWLAILAVLLFWSAPLHGQFNASLNGTVTDPSGALVSGVTVTLTDAATGEIRTAISNASGIYEFTALPPDHFSLTAEKEGFKSRNVATIVLTPEAANSLDLKLEVGNAQETVTVNGSEVPALDTSDATDSATIDTNAIQHLPSFNRDVFQLAQLTPGVFGDGSQAAGGGTYNLPGNQGPGGSGGSAAGIFQTENGPQIQTQGGQYETNSITIDGISTVSAVWGGTSVITPSEDSVADVTVVSNDYDAQYGRFTGAQIQVTSKSGTNELHGSYFFKASRPGLNAYQRWNGVASAVSGTPASRGLNRNQNRFNNYGGSLGGPFWKNRLFGFFNYETSPLSTPGTAQGWYETSQFDSTAATSGSIAAKYLSFKGESVASGSTLIGSETCADIGLTEGTNCKTTSAGLDVGSPLKNGLGAQDPTYGGSTSTPGVGGGLDGVPDIAMFTTVNPTTVSQTQYNGRLDAQVTQKDHAAFTIYWLPETTTDFNGPARAANFWHHSQVNDAFSLIWNHTFTPTLLNEARANAAGWRWNEVTSNPQAPFGLPQDNINNEGPNGSIQFFGAPGPSNLNQWTFDYEDVLTKIMGKHSIKTGGGVTRLYYLNNPVYAARPGFNFRNIWDFANDAPYEETGQFDHSTGIPFANRQDNRVDVWGFFVQDDYKIRPNLTINAGLRWSYFGTYSSKENNLDVLQFGAGASRMSGLNIRVGGGLYTPPKSNWGPQIGFAWLPRQFAGKVVMRGGFGVNYNQNEIAITANGNGNPPNAVQIDYCCSTPAGNAPGILYETASSINSIFGYAPNPATITTFGSNNLPTSGSAFVTGFPANPNTITELHYSLETEYQMPENLVFGLGYMGSRTRNLLVQMNYNLVAAAQGLALNPRVNFLDYYTNTGSGNYNSMLVTLKHNFARQFSAEAEYTWAKAMDENSGPYSEDPYPWNSHAAYGRSDYNVGQAFKLYGIWQPVIFHGGQGWMEKVVGGWTFSGIWNAHSGFPFNPLYNLNTTGGIVYNGSGYSQLRPAAYVGGAGTSTSRSVFESKTNPNYGGNAAKYFTAPTFVDGPAFPATAPVPAVGIERNSLNGPGYNDLDASVTKAFGLPEMRVLGGNARFEVRMDAYNVFNRLNINDSSISNVVGSVNPNGTVTSVNSQFGVAGSALGSRTVQLQARFSF